MKKQYLFLILVIYLIGCIMNLCYYIVIYGTFFSMQILYLEGCNQLHIMRNIYK